MYFSGRFCHMQWEENDVVWVGIGDGGYLIMHDGPAISTGRGDGDSPGFFEDIQGDETDDDDEDDDENPLKD